MERHKSGAVLAFLWALLTLASSCSISTDMVSNILSWVELFSSGVVSDLQRKPENGEQSEKRFQVVCFQKMLEKVLTFVCLYIS